MNAKDHLRNILVMALADGSLGEREVNFVTDRCLELGLGEAELKDAISYALNDDAAIKLPTDPLQQEALLVDLLKMMAADGMLMESEKRLFALAAAKLHFDHERMDELVAKAKQS
jgi:hypothetical protein